VPSPVWRLESQQSFEIHANLYILVFFGIVAFFGGKGQKDTLASVFFGDSSPHPEIDVTGMSSESQRCQ